MLYVRTAIRTAAIILLIRFISRPPDQGRLKLHFGAPAYVKVLIAPSSLPLAGCRVQLNIHIGKIRLKINSRTSIIELNSYYLYVELYMFYRYILLGLLLITAVVWDFRSYKISNVLIAAGLAAGLVSGFAADGVKGLVSAVLAALVPAVLLILLFALRMLGAGDIKLFCAVGAIMGLPFVLYAMAYSFLAGGVMALLIIAVRGNAKQRLGHIATYLKTCFLSGKFSPYTDFDDKSDGAKFHFSLAIAAGCAVQTALLLLQ
jgi:prepilin peptidase CpaA